MIRIALAHGSNCEEMSHASLVHVTKCICDYMITDIYAEALAMCLGVRVSGCKVSGLLLLYVCYYKLTASIFPFVLFFSQGTKFEKYLRGMFLSRQDCIGFCKAALTAPIPPEEGGSGWAP